ncbi:uncharacterized protein BJX67DRAFT_383197 [Aspergillus lucknowensis]|uniref:Uncharacterized protein n=1 Tax=Aspergillus lucknowensis TaxID=176173 RepID=A0ABR4LKF2_9EURO
MTNALSAVSTLVGYIGTEVPTSQCFDRVVWPQRSYNNFTVGNAWKSALLMPMGGPLQTAALRTIDALFRNGLMRGPRLGLMLGTCFFPDSALQYRLYENGVNRGMGHVRNGIWPRVLNGMPMRTRALQGQHEDEEQPMNSVVMVLWLVPLILKLTAACFAVPRQRFTPEPLADEPQEGSQEQASLEDFPKASFYLENGQELQIIEGPIHLVRPFFRHYGHPRGQRSDELV